MADVSKVKLPNNSVYNLKDKTQTRSDHRHYDSDLVPLVSKTYASTSYYSTNDSWDNSTWYFMSIKPDAWYKPWRVKFKVHSYCPNYASYHSYTWSTFCGRSDGIIYANWNEKQNTTHDYIAVCILKQAGFDAGYGHALGVSIRYGDNYTNSNYYRTFEVDYYECENCTVTILDTPVKWADWSGTGTTYYNSISTYDAVNRGLRESSDDDTYDNRIVYFAGKTGSKGIWATSLFMEDGSGTYQNICTATDGTVTSSNRTTGTKVANTNGFKVGSCIYYTNTNYNANTNISGWGVIYKTMSTLFDSRYSLNTTLTANSLTPYAPVYLVGTINASDGLFYLDSTWWTQTPADTSKVYVLIGGCFDSTTSNCRITLYEENPWYRYDGSRLVIFSGNDITKLPLAGGTMTGALIPNGGINFTATGLPQFAGSPPYYLGIEAFADGGQVKWKSAPDCAVGSATKATQDESGNNIKATYANSFSISDHTITLKNKNGASLGTVTVPDNNTTYTFANGTNGFTVTPSGGTAQTVTVTPSIANNITGSGTSGYLTKFNGTNTVTNGPQLGSSTTTYLNNAGNWATPPDTKNTAGSTDTSSKIFLIGATSQATNPQTYSDNEVYATSGVLTTKSVQVGGGSATMQYNSTTQAIDFVFA